jgi:hypothetical protein
MSVEPTHPHGEVFLDARGQGRALRLTWHHEADVVVLSLWRDRFCAGTFRLSTTDVNDFVDALVEGLRDAPAEHDVRSAQPPVVPHTGAIDVTPPAPGTAPDDDNDDNDEDGFVEWALRTDGGRATA